MMTMFEKTYFENRGWYVYYNEEHNRFFLYWTSPANEDLKIEVDGDYPISDFCSKAVEFDPEKHAESRIPYRGQDGIPNSIRTILDDADIIKKEFDTIVEFFYKNKQKQYEQYKIDWMKEKGLTIQDLFDCLIEYYEICFSDLVSDCGMRSFLAFWEQNYGFSKKGKGIWLSYKDWFYSVEKKEASTK